MTDFSYFEEHNNVVVTLSIFCKQNIQIVQHFPFLCS